MADVGSDVWVTTAAGRLHACVEGPRDAPWLTCLHSLATNLHLWDAQAESLAGHFRLLRLDMRGHGDSATATDNFSIADLRDDVLAVWDELNVTRSSVLGLSIGGMIALALGLDQPDRVHRVVAADCRADAPPAFRAIWDDRQRLLDNGGMPAIVAATLPTWFTAATLDNNRDLVDSVSRMIASTSHDGYLGATRALQSLDLLSRLGEMSLPVLYVVGEEDGIHPEAMRDMAQATPGAALELLPAASHLSNLEQPQRFLERVLPFLQSEAVACS